MKHQIPSQGLQEEAIFERLEAYRSQDLDWRGGQAFAYIYDAGRRAEKIGKKASSMYLTENGLDPTSFPSLLRMENELLAISLAHLQGGESSAGTFTSGGTESIMLACKSAREWARANKPEIATPEMILPETAHAAFHKAAHYLGFKTVMVPVNKDTLRAVPEAMAAAVTDQTVLMVGSSPSYAHGVIDPIEALGAIAQERGLLFHVDACVGGWLLPYLKRAGAEVPAFDFSVAGVTSISMDLHKYAFTPKGASVVLYRDAALRHHQIFACDNWTGYTVVNMAVQSSKSGGPLAAAWAVVHAIGDEGYLQLASGVREATESLMAGIAGIEGLRVLGNPDFCMFAFESDGPSVFHIADEMKVRGWHVQPQHRFGDHKENIHLSIHPGNVTKVEPFLAALRESVEAARALQPSPVVAMIGDQLGSIDASDLGPEAVGNMMAMLGVKDGALPERLAPINEILNIMPPKLSEEILKTFFNDIFKPA